MTAARHSLCSIHGEAFSVLKDRLAGVETSLQGYFDGKFEVMLEKLSVTESLIKQVELRQNAIDKRLSELERWRWLLAGGIGVLSWLAPIILKAVHIL